MSLQPIDYLFLALLLLFVLDGLRRGLVRTGLDLLTLALAIIAAASWHEDVAEYLNQSLDLAGGLARLIAFVAILIFVQVVAVIPASIVGGIFKTAFGVSPTLCILDRMAGVAPGLGRGVILVGLVSLAWLRLPATESLRPDEPPLVASRLADFVDVTTPLFGALLDGLRLDVAVVPPTGPTTVDQAPDLDFPADIALEVDPTSEATLLRLLNRERNNYGLPLVEADDGLRRVARAHSEEMFRLSYFAHDSPVRGTLLDRLTSAGLTFDLAGENLAYAPTAELAHYGLMQSESHRANILAPAYHRVGIGVIRAGTWGRMVTQDFAD